MPFAESCLVLFKETGEPCYRQACEQWIEQIASHMPARDGQGAYAEQYGRCLHFLLGCARELDHVHARTLARRLADEAVATLWDGAMFRSHPGEHRYDAVDGVGWLLLALLALETGVEPDMMGSGW